MPPSTHATLGASSAHRWMQCPGSVRLCQGIKSVSSIYAEEGTAAHALAETCLRKNQIANHYLGRFIRLLDGGYSILKAGAASKEGDFEVTEEMVEAVQAYLYTIRSDAALLPNATLEIEKKFDLSEFFPGMFGTNDACLAEPFGKLKVYDLKYGAGHAVEVVQNPQLLYYALGAYYGEDFETVEIVIVQPRARHKDGPVRRWELPITELRKWALEDLLPAAKATEDPNAPVVPGNHCKFCPALPVCKGFQDHAMAVTKSDFQTIELPDPKLLGEADLLKVMASTEILKTWLNGVFAYAQDMLMGGGSLPGWKLVAKKTNRKWADETAVTGRLTKYKDQGCLVTKPLSVAQMEKWLKAKGLQDVVNLDDLIEKPEGGLTLVPEADRRPAVEVNPAADFENLEELEF